MRHAEIEEGEVQVLGPIELHLFFLQVGGEPSSRRSDVHELNRHAVDQVVLAVQESEPAWLRLFDDVHLHAIDLRQALTPHLCRNRLRHRITRRGLLGVELLAIARIALEHHTRRALPLGETVGSRANRMLHRALGIGFDDLARDGAGQVAEGEVVDERRLRFLECDAICVAVDRAQAFDLAVVVELAALERCFAQRVHPCDALVDEIKLH